MSLVDKTKFNPADVWQYQTRTLTQAKFPFWSAIITQTYGSVSIAAGATVYVDIQPPSGETWWINILIACPDGGAYNKHVVAVYTYDGSTRNQISVAGAHNGNDRSYGAAIQPSSPGSSLVIITNSLYASISFYSNVAATGYYGYSGFKLSQPLYQVKRLDPPKPWKRKTQFPIPSQVQPLAKYIVDLIDFTINDYRQAIICEENTPLAIDEKGNVIERMTVTAWVDEFINNILTPYKAGKLDLVKAGWKKYFDKWLNEGITL